MGGTVTLLILTMAGMMLTSQKTEGQVPRRRLASLSDCAYIRVQPPCYAKGGESLVFDLQDPRRSDDGPALGYLQTWSIEDEIHEKMIFVASSYQGNSISSHLRALHVLYREHRDHIDQDQAMEILAVGGYMQHYAHGYRAFIKDDNDTNTKLEYKSLRGADAVNQVFKDCFEMTSAIRRDADMHPEEKKKLLTNAFKRFCFPNFPDTSVHNPAFNIPLNTNVTMVHRNPLGFWKVKGYSFEKCDGEFVEIRSKGYGHPSYCQLFTLRRHQANRPDVCLSVLGEPIAAGNFMGCLQNTIPLRDFERGAHKVKEFKETPGEGESSTPAKLEPKAKDDSDATCLWCDKSPCSCPDPDRRRRLAGLASSNGFKCNI